MTSDELKRECDTCRERVSERLGSIEQRITTLEVTLWGQHGENGLRSDIREMKRKMDMILRWVWVTSALPPLTVGLIAILKFLGKL